MKKLIFLITLLAAALSSNAHAANRWFSFGANHSNLGALASPGQITDTFNLSGPPVPVQVDFEIRGYGSLDGDNAYRDLFNLTLNGRTLLTATWDLGGGGANVVYYNPEDALIHPVSNGSFAGGSVYVSIPMLWLQSGLNTLSFSYSGDPQGLADEGWGINYVSVIQVPEPATYALLLAGLGLLGFMTRRKAGRLPDAGLVE